MSASPGIPFGSYVLIKRLARGGMAEVFLGRQKGPQGFDRLVAVKRVLPHLADSPEFIRMFFDEARLAAKLSHPHVVHIYEFGKVDEDYFIAMEYVHGVHAGELIAKASEEPIPPVLIARLGADACAGLHYAHTLHDERGRELNLVHRDVSPPNLLISYDGTVKLVDFGIAKAAISVEQTRPGVVKGKYAYMSPEQTVGKRLSHKSDVFSLAMVMWEMLAGQVAVSRDDKVEAMKMIRDGKVPRLEKYRPDMPPALSLALTMAMQVDPDQRLSALDFKIALEEYIKTQPGLVSAIEVASWIRDRFPWESPTGDSTIDSLLTRATQAGTHATVTGTRATNAGDVEPPEDERSTILFADEDRRRFIESAATVPTPPPEALDMMDATEIATGPPQAPAAAGEISGGTSEPSAPGEEPKVVYPTITSLPQSETIRPPMKFPEPPSRPDIQSPVTAMAASIPSAPRRPVPHGRAKRIGIAAGAALLLGVGVLLAVSGGDDPTGAGGPVTGTMPEPSPDAGAGDVAPPGADAGAVVVAGTDAAPRRATVEIATRPSGAQVTLAGRDTLPAPALFSGLDAGNYFVRVELDGYVPVERTIAVEAGQYRTVELVLVELPPTPGPPDAGAATDDGERVRRRDDRPGRLVVRTSPYSVVYLKGRKFDTTPFTRKLRPGTYKFTFKHPGYRTERRTVRIRPGKKRKLFFNLRK